MSASAYTEDLCVTSFWRARYRNEKAKSCIDLHICKLIVRCYYSTLARAVPAIGRAVTGDP